MNILTVSQNPTDATSFYRGYGVMGPLSKQFPDVKIISGQDRPLNWSSFADIDILYLQRPTTRETNALCQIAKACNVPIVIDYDDDVFSIQKDNPSSEYYNLEKARQDIVHMFEMASMIFVSTKKLKSLYKKINNNIHVIPNCHNDFILKNKPEPLENQEIVCWRGSATHEMDLYTYGQQLTKSIKESHSWKFLFLGYTPYTLITQFVPQDKIMSKGYMDTMYYFHVLHQHKPKVMIVPLQFNDFNESKSNIAWIEGTYLGAVSIVPAMEEWKVPGVLSYHNPEEFEAHLWECIHNRVNYKKLHKQSWDYIQDNLLLSDWNKKRYDLLKTLL